MLLLVICLIIATKHQEKNNLGTKRMILSHNHMVKMAWLQEPEVAGHTASTVEKLTSFSPFYLFQDSSLWNCIAHIQGGSSAPNNLI